MNEIITNIRASFSGKIFAFLLLTLLSLTFSEEIHAQNKAKDAYVMINGRRIDFICAFRAEVFLSTHSSRGNVIYLGTNPVIDTCDNELIYRWTDEEWTWGIVNLTNIALEESQKPCPETPGADEDKPADLDGTDRDPDPNRLSFCIDTIYTVRLITRGSEVIRRDTVDIDHNKGVPCPGVAKVKVVTWNDCDDCTESNAVPVEPTEQPFDPNGWDMFAGGEFGRFDDQLSPTYVGVRFGAEHNWDHLYAGGNFSVGYLYASPYHDRPFLQSAYDDQVETWGRGLQTGKAGVEVFGGYQTKGGFRAGVTASFNGFVQPEPLKLESASSSDVWKNRADRPVGYWSGGITVGYKSRNAHHPFSIEAVAQVTTDVSFWTEPSQVGETKEPNTFFGGTWHAGSGNFGGVRATVYFR